MNTVVLSADGALADAQQKSEGVWHAAWRRFRMDKVGLASALIVILFLVLIAAAGVGIVMFAWLITRPSTRLCSAGGSFQCL